MTCRLCGSAQIVVKGLCRAHYQRERPGSSVTIYVDGAAVVAALDAESKRRGVA